MFLYVSYKETKGYYSTKKTICQQAINKYNKIPCSATKGWSPVIHCFGVFGLYGNEYDVNKNETVLIGFGACPL